MRAIWYYEPEDILRGDELIRQVRADDGALLNTCCTQWVSVADVLPDFFIGCPCSALPQDPLGRPCFEVIRGDLPRDAVFRRGGPAEAMRLDERPPGRLAIPLEEKP